ncbi:signal peptidase I [Candidatus Dojkabacteria bacterium]|nr:signal peptidase I [Candidatus Dojkabacteria bacterium]
MSNPFFYDPPENQVKGGVIIDIMQTIVIALAIFVFVYIFLAIPNQVDGQSMEPNFYHNELLLTNKVIQYIGDKGIGERLNYDYKRGDVVILHLPNNPDFIKRIIAGPGDTIMIINNKVVVNDKILNEAYIPTTTKTEPGTFLKEGVEVTIPQGHYFVMGDNRQASKDSRSADVGFVSRDYLKGKVFLRWWPLNKFGLIGTGDFTEQEYQDDNDNSDNPEISQLRLPQVLYN